MQRPVSPRLLESARALAGTVFNSLERFVHVEAISGIVLLLAAATALVWANSPAAESYVHFWHEPVSIGFGDSFLSQPLHFWINDGLMTIFFLVVGLEIRREIHEGALATLRLAALPLAAAVGGVVVPALIYSAFNTAPEVRPGWAVPTATDIAFAVGVLALLGRSVPPALRVLLLALAIVDDILAVLIIAIFYSSGFNLAGLLIAAVGLVLVLMLQRVGIASALAYVVPGALVWAGFLEFGVHPTLAGVVLGLLTPAQPLTGLEGRQRLARRAAENLQHHFESEEAANARTLLAPVKELARAQRDIVPPVVRVEAALHPWVAYGIMPLFALANAGVVLNGFDFVSSSASTVAAGVFAGLVAGKPIGILLASWIAVRLGWSQLPTELSWRSVCLVGCLGGIGFTMSVFIANLAFRSEELLSAAKLGILAASACAAIVGLVLGKLLLRSATARS